MESRSIVTGRGHKARWVVAHEELCELSRRRGELEWLEGGALLRALRTNVHRHLGFGSFAEYVERLFGYGGEPSMTSCARRLLWRGCRHFRKRCGKAL
jgi:hypothetical protein